MPPKPRSVIDRFAEKIALTDSGCVEWIAGANENGYGVFFISKTPRRKSVKAHRWSYEHHVGAIPDTLVLDHLCRNPACVNPEHLEPVSQAENIMRGASPSAIHAALTHCPSGHPYSGPNLYVDPSGSRHCRECKRARDRRYWHARKDQVGD